MAIHTEMIEKGRVIRVTFEGTLTRQDFEALDAQLVPVFDVALQPLHLLADVVHLTKVESDVLGIRQLTLLAHANAGHYFVFGASLIVRSIANIFNRLSGNEKSHFFATEAEAHAALENMLAENVSTKA